MTTQPPSETEAISLFDRIVDFCRQNGSPHCFNGWDERVVREYVAFHLKQRTMVWAKADDQVQGVMFCWQCVAEELMEEPPEGKVFDWTPTNPYGNALLLAGTIARPGVLPVLANAMLNHWTNWQWFRLFSRRHGRLKEFDPAHVDAWLKNSLGKAKNFVRKESIYV